MAASRNQEDSSGEDENFEEEEEGDDLDDGQNARKESKKRKGSSLIDDAAEEDDDEDDDDDEVRYRLSLKSLDCCAACGVSLAADHWRASSMLPVVPDCIEVDLNALCGQVHSFYRRRTVADTARSETGSLTILLLSMKRRRKRTRSDLLLSGCTLPLHEDAFA